MKLFHFFTFGQLAGWLVGWFGWLAGSYYLDSFPHPKSLSPILQFQILSKLDENCRFYSRSLGQKSVETMKPCNIQWRIVFSQNSLKTSLKKLLTTLVTLTSNIFARKTVFTRILALISIVETLKLCKLCKRIVAMKRWDQLLSKSTMIYFLIQLLIS